MPVVAWIIGGALWTLVLLVGTWTAAFRFLARDRAELKESGEDAPIPAASAAVSPQQRELLSRIERAVGPERDFIAYPTDCVIGVIDSPEQAAAATEAFIASGIDHADVNVMRGHKGAMTIDSAGKYHGLIVRLIRIIDAATMDEGHSDRYEREAEAGHLIMAVHIRNAAQRSTVENIFRDHDGHFVNWYGRLHFEPVIPRSLAQAWTPTAKGGPQFRSARRSPSSVNPRFAPERTTKRDTDVRGVPGLLTG